MATEGQFTFCEKADATCATGSNSRAYTEYGVVNRVEGVPLADSI